MSVKTLIAYGTRYGAAAECAAALKERLPGDVDVIHLAEGSAEASEYDQVIVGGSIYMGQIQSHVKKFVQGQQEALLSRPLGLFLCCGRTDAFAEQFQNAFPESMRQHARRAECFGYAYSLERMKFLDRWILKVVAKVARSERSLDFGAIGSMAAQFSSQGGGTHDSTA